MAECSTAGRTMEKGIGPGQKRWQDEQNAIMHKGGSIRK